MWFPLTYFEIIKMFSLYFSPPGYKLYIKGSKGESMKVPTWSGVLILSDGHDTVLWSLERHCRSYICNCASDLRTTDTLDQLHPCHHYLNELQNLWAEYLKGHLVYPTNTSILLTKPGQHFPQQKLEAGCSISGCLKLLRCGKLNVIK